MVQGVALLAGPEQACPLPLPFDGCPRVECPVRREGAASGAEAVLQAADVAHEARVRPWIKQAASLPSG